MTQSKEPFAVATKKTISTRLAPTPKGPYSQGVVAGNFLFVAGQGPVDPRTGRLLLGDIRSESKQTLENIKAILKAGGAGLEDIVRCTVYLRDLRDFHAMNEVYRRFFPRHPPARTTVGAGDLLGDIRVEIDAIAFLPRKEAAIHHRPHPRARSQSSGR